LGVTDKEAESPLLRPLEDFRQDNDIIALTQASLDADTLKMAAALPAGTRAYELHVTGLGRWIASIQRGAVLSKKVILVADMAMIAISIYQVAKMPVVPAGGSSTPPTILGTLPGGVAVGSAVNLASLARALEAIRKLVAIGALDGALVAGVGSLGGGSGIAVPELQRPTSLAVQAPGGSSSGSGASGSHTTPGAQDTALPDSYWTDKRLPKQVTPGTRRIDIGKPSGRSTGEVYEKTGHYDKHGRLVAITDRTAHGEPALHPNPHHHRFDPITGARIKNPETGNFNWPGEYTGP
jgi:hypothetical protein